MAETKANQKAKDRGKGASDRTLILAVDIGSSRLHAGLVDTDKMRCLCRDDFPIQEMDKRLPELPDKMFRKTGLRKAATPMSSVIAGGRDGLAAKARKILSLHGLSPIADLRWPKRLPLRFLYETPESLGADRIADTLFTVAKYPNRNAIVIDAGTAITVDLISCGREFFGGTIFPGIKTQLESLHRATGALPLLDARVDPVSLPGTSTESCMRAGVIYGIAGGLNLFVRRFRSILGGRSVVLATGGGWEPVKGLVDFKPIYVPDMTLIGTALSLKAEG